MTDAHLNTLALIIAFLIMLAVVVILASGNLV
jgi:hypothetical protein